jgi:hypothetical protein
MYFCLLFVGFSHVMVVFVRSELQAVAADHGNAVHCHSLVTTLLVAFNKHFGTGQDGTVALEHHTRGGMMRPKGIPLFSLISSLLDPRFKTDVGLSDADLDILWAEVMDKMIVYATINRNHAPVNENEVMDVQLDNNANADAFENLQDAGGGNEFNIYEFINELVNATNEGPAQVLGGEHDVQQVVDAELFLYKAEPVIRVQANNGSFSNSKDWWRRKQEK